MTRPADRAGTFHAYAAHRAAARGRQAPTGGRRRSAFGGGRGGVTLMEVLIAIFVGSVGLLGLMSLLPLGTYHMAEAIKADRSGTLGRAALDDLAIRGYLRPDMWLDFNGNAVLQTDGTLSLAPPFVIDPLTMSNTLLNPTVPARFPAQPLAGAMPPEINRINLRRSPGGLVMPYALAERIFTAEDDIIFTMPEDADRRPSVGAWTVGADGDWGVSGTDDDGNGTVDDASEAGWPGSDDSSPVNAEGAYSWLVTLSPTLDEMRLGGGPAMRNFSAAVVIFQQRNLTVPNNAPVADPPQERMVYADFPTAGEAFGGGSVLLRTAASAGGVKWLELRPNQWIMLSASFFDPYLDSSAGAGDGRRAVLAWYRVAAVDEGILDTSGSGAGPWQRNVTLAGPDWPALNTVAPMTPGSVYVDADTSNPEPTVYATILDGVVAVHEETIREGVSIWAP